MVAERFELNDVFALGFDNITTTLGKLYKRVGILVEINPTGHTLSPAADVYELMGNSQMTIQDTEVRPHTHAVIWDPRSTEPPSCGTQSSRAQATAGYLSQVASTHSHVAGMSLGPTGDALIQAHVRYTPAEQPAHDGATRRQPTEMRDPDRPQFLPIADRPNHPETLTAPRGEDAGGESAYQLGR